MTALPSLLLVSLAGCFSPEVPADTSATESSSETESPSSSGATGTADTTNSDTGSSTNPTAGDTSAGETDEAEDTGDPSETDSTSGSDSGGIPTTCGNAELDDGEACDDGNDEDGDGCNNDCVESGTVHWTATFDDGDDTATSLAIDPDDNILALAHVGSGGSGEFSNWQRLYSPDGDALETSAPARDFASIDIDDSGNVLGVYFSAAPSVILGIELGVAEVEPNGDLVWSANLPGPGYAGRVSLLPDGGVVVGGAIRDGSSSYYYGHEAFLQAYDSAGSEAWEEAPLPSNSSCAGLATSPDGTVATLCYVNYGSEYQVRRYSMTGTLQWERDIDVSSQAWSGRYLDVDRRNIFVPGVSQNTDGRIAVAIPLGFNTPMGAQVVAFEQTGEEAYSTTITGSGDLLPRDLAVLADGSVVLVGSDSNPDDGTDIDIMIRRLAPDGSPQWGDLVGGAPGGEDRAREVELDSRGDIVVFGSTEDGSGNRDLWLRKYAP